MPTPSADYTLRRTCRLCLGGVLDPVLDLGDLAFSAFPLPEEITIRRQAPLSLVLCRACGLAQLRQTVQPDLLFRQYWYRSSINETMQAELTSIVRAALLEVSVFPRHDLVIDVGANDGFLLSQYPRQRAHWDSTRIAFEPATNLQPLCRPHAEVLIPDYFPPSEADAIGWEGRVKILTSIAVFYDLDEPAGFVRAVDRLLHPEGVWILQLQDLAQMIEATAFDNLCHEHLTYWSLASFETLLDTCGVDLQVTHVEQRAINGGSLRLHVRRRAFPRDRTVEHLRQVEQASISWQGLERFAWRVGEVRLQIRDAVCAWVAEGATIDLYGASTKANTLLQFCGLGPGQLRQAWERNPDKVGRLTATGIPIVDEASGRSDPPALLLAGIWQFRDGILLREVDYLLGGGKILFPLPEVDVVVMGQPGAQSA